MPNKVIPYVKSGRDTGYIRHMCDILQMQKPYHMGSVDKPRLLLPYLVHPHINLVLSVKIDSPNMLWIKKQSADKTYLDLGKAAVQRPTIEVKEHVGT